MSETIEPKYKPGDVVLIGDNSNMCAGECVIITEVERVAAGEFVYKWKIPERLGSSPEKFIDRVLMPASRNASG